MVEVTIPIRKEDLGDAKDAEDFFNKLANKHEGKWVAVLKTDGQIITGMKLETLYSEVGAREIAILFRAPKKGELRA